jgi:hypothetical protein
LTETVPRAFTTAITDGLLGVGVNMWR